MKLIELDEYVNKMYNFSYQYIFAQLTVYNNVDEIKTYDTKKQDFLITRRKQIFGIIRSFGGCWRFLMGVWHLELEMDRVNGL